MKILILSNNAGGLYHFRKELLETLARDNEVHFCVPEGPYIDALQKLGCSYIPCTVLDRRSINPLKDLKLLRFYRTTIKKLSPDVVLTYTIKPNVYGGMACAAVGAPYIANVTGLGTSIENGGLLSTIATALYKRGLRKARCVFFQNENNQRLFLEKKLVTGKTRLIPGSGVNLETHQYETYPSDEQGVRFLFVGRIMRDKGIGELLTAVRAIHAERTDVTLDVVGGNEEDYSAELDAAQCEGTIVYHGSQADMHPFYTSCHCVVLPSYHEGTANVLLEGSATGRPVIATRVPGCQETFDEGVTGFGCQVKSADSLTEAMKKFLALSQAQRAGMGRAAREKMEREYDRRLVVEAYLQEIESVLKG